jgi:hypothetical protein
VSVYEQLAAPFATAHWRAQTLKADGTSALALAYIDARDVMERLDSVLGPENWQDRYAETPKGRLICTLALRIGGEWIEKQDGAGETDVEGDKGAISDSLKRAAVKWGIGRYLYALPATWAECESYERNGKKQWKGWTPQGLRKLTAISGTAGPAPKAVPAAELDGDTISDDERDVIQTLASQAGVTLKKICESYGVASLKAIPASKAAEVKQRLNQTIEDKKEAA